MVGKKRRKAEICKEELSFGRSNVTPPLSICGVEDREDNSRIRRACEAGEMCLANKDTGYVLARSYVPEELDSRFSVFRVVSWLVCVETWPKK